MYPNGSLFAWLLLAFAVATAASAAEQAPAGSAPYKQYCSYCHDDGTTGAPRIGDREAWQPLLEKGTVTLAKNTWEGRGHMSARQEREGLDYGKMLEALHFLVESSK
jgi:cytochrome c5